MRDTMWIVAWSINHGNNEIDDHWIVVEIQAEALDEIGRLKDTQENLWVWAIAPCNYASEPHWMNRAVGEG